MDSGGTVAPDYQTRRGGGIMGEPVCESGVRHGSKVSEGLGGGLKS